MTTEELNALIAQAEGGNAEAATQLNAIAWEYQYGNNGRTIDLQMAYQLYTIAAECGNIDARATRAYCLYHGIGVEKDTQQSFQLYEQLANEGAQMGLSNLGWFYLGNSIEKDLQKAIYWFTRAAEEYGNIFSMKNLTHIYGEEEGFINHEQAAKWFLELIKRDCDPNSGVYENTGYNKDLYEKIKNAILDSATEDDMLSSLSGGPAGGSLLGGAMYFTTSNAKSYINQAEEAIQHNIEYKEEQRRIAAEEEARKRAEEERLRREAEERAKREREEKERQERERREQEEKEKRIQAFCIKVSKDYDDQSGFNRPFNRFSKEMEIIKDEEVWWYEEERIGGYIGSKKEYKKTLIIPEGVTHIGNNVFWQHGNSFNSIELPRTLTSIGKWAFGHTSLRFDLIIPSNVTSIGEGAFCHCGLTSVIIPDSVTSIENETFDYCLSLSSVTIGNSVTSIGNRAFGCCSSLTSITIPNSVTSIGELAFVGCSSLTSITIPNSVTSIGEFAFCACSGLTSETIPNSVTRIGIGAFLDCKSLKKIIVPKGTKQRFTQMEGLKGLEDKIVEE